MEYIEACLEQAGLQALSMSFDLARSMAALRSFGREGAPRVLLLSSQYHASGVNLQAARNLILVHPYCTPSASCPEAVSYTALRAYEMQAIGRVRRYPQQKACRVFRLYAEGSVEQSLYSGLYNGGLFS